MCLDVCVCVCVCFEQDNPHGPRSLAHQQEALSHKGWAVDPRTRVCAWRLCVRYRKRSDFCEIILRVDR